MFVFFSKSHFWWSVILIMVNILNYSKKFVQKITYSNIPIMCNLWRLCIKCAFFFWTKCWQVVVMHIAVCSLSARKVTVTFCSALMSVKHVHTLSLSTPAEFVHIRRLDLRPASSPCRYHATRCLVPMTTRCMWKVRSKSVLLFFDLLLQYFNIHWGLAWVWLVWVTHEKCI